jgi:hypothetical protein
MALLTKPERYRFWKNSKRIIIFAAVFIIAALCNIDYEARSEFQNRVTSTVSWNGPVFGIGVCVIICMVLAYSSFIAIQDFLIARNYLTSRVTTNFDMLPWGILLLMMFGYSSSGDTWHFKWAGQEMTFWYFLALLAAVFSLQAYTVVRRVANQARQDAGK